MANQKIRGVTAPDNDRGGGFRSIFEDGGDNGTHTHLQYSFHRGGKIRQMVLFTFEKGVDQRIALFPENFFQR